MTYTPLPGARAGKAAANRILTADPRRAQTPAIHAFRGTPVPHDRVTPLRATTPARHRFTISALLDTGEMVHFDHMAPRDIYLEDICANIARGSLIATPDGHVAIEDLMPGDLVKTRDGTAHPIRWISSTTYPVSDDDAAMETLRIKADALGELRPLQDLVVSTSFRLLTNHPRCAELFGSAEALAPATDFLDGDMILRTRASPHLEFFNLMTTHHQIIEVNGLETETYHPGRFGVSVMSLEAQSHLRQIFPHLNGDLGAFGQTVRPILKGFEAEALQSY